MIYSLFNHVGKLAYPVWLVKDGLNGYFTQGVRDTCYWLLQKDTQSMSWAESFTYQMEKTATCERVSNAVFNNQYLGSVSLGVIVSVQANKLYRKNQYNNYRNKTDQDFKSLTEEMRSSFSLGVQSSKSKVVRGINLLKYDVWRHPHAYYAGFEAGRKDNQEMIAKARLAP